MCEGNIEVETRSLTSLQEIIDAAGNLSTEWPDESIWWRGQTSSAFKLIAGAYRDNRNKTNEVNMTLNFRLKAPARYPNCPKEEDYANWLFLMQHYGLPTRLLDWTASVLVAVFFAVRAKPDKDAMIFAITAGRMNLALNGNEGIYLPSLGVAKDLFAEAFTLEQSQHGAVAVEGPTTDIRILVQQGMFTIHGDNVPLEDQPQAESFLRRFVIPANKKIDLTQQLESIGLRHSYLFPDLTHLALDLKRISSLPDSDL